MKRALILMLVLSCLIGVDGCKKDKGSDAGAQFYSGASVEELEKEFDKVMADCMARKMPGDECDKRVTELTDKISTAREAAAAPVSQFKERGKAKLGTLHIINIPATLLEPGGETSGVVEEKYEYKPRALKVYGVGEITVMGSAIKEQPGKYPPYRGLYFEIANDNKRVPSPNGDSITVSVLMTEGNDSSIIDFEDAEFQQVFIHWNPPENISKRSCPLYGGGIIFKNGVGTADCKSAR